MSQIDIPGLIGSLPPGTNVFEVLDAVVRGYLQPRLSDAFFVNLYVLSGVYILWSVFMGAAILLRVVRKDYWLIRRVRTRGGVYLMPNTGMIFPLATLPFNAAAAGSCFAMIAYYRDGRSFGKIFLWRSLIFVPLLFAWICQSWSVLGSTDFNSSITVDLSNRPHRSSDKRLRMRYILTNVAFVSLPILISLSVIIPLLYSSRIIDQILDQLVHADALLAPLAASFNGTVDETILSTVVSDMGSIQPLLDTFTRRSRVAWAMDVIWITSVTTTFIVFGIRLLIQIRKQLQTIKNGLRSAERSSIHSKSGVLSTESATTTSTNLVISTVTSDQMFGARLSELQRAAMYISCYILTIFVTGVSYGSACFWVALDPLPGLSDPVRIERLTLWTLWTWPVTGTIITITVFLRAWDGSSLLGTRQRRAMPPKEAANPPSSDFDFDDDDIEFPKIPMAPSIPVPLVLPTRSSKQSLSSNPAASRSTEFRSLERTRSGDSGGSYSPQNMFSGSWRPSTVLLESGKSQGSSWANVKSAGDSGT